MATIVVPDFRFAAFYYPELLEALIAYKRQNVPELTEELPQDPLIQMIRMMACVGHTSNTTIDLVANETFLSTAKLADSVREQLRLIGYELQPASPAQSDIVYELSKVFTASFELINEGAQVANPKEGDEPVVYFEALTSLTIGRTDQLGYVYSSDAGVFTDHTADANSPTTPADDWTPWPTPASMDCLYFGHSTVMWNKLSFLLTSGAVNIVGVWEYYDGDWAKSAPTSVTDIGGGQLEINLSSLLGTQNRQGTQIRVLLNDTGSFEYAYSTWTGSANVVTTGLLGQSSPSTTATDYTVGSDWSILENATDGTSQLTLDGALDYTLPQSLSENWSKATVNSVEAFWVRFRIITASTPTSPTIITARIDEGKQYAIRLATQGKTHTDDPLGSSTGLADQTFETSQDNFIPGSAEVTVDSIAWTEVDNFLASKSGDKHYQVVLGSDDKASIVFGNGTNGRIPPLGVGNVTAQYRHGANENGNVGAQTLTVDKTGLTYINKLWNPRQSNGWSEAQGASEESLELAKIQGPASLRTKEVAISADDVANLTVSTYTDENGAKPFSRAFAIEEGFGPKTIELVVVTRGGSIASTTQLDNLDDYFNGDKYSIPPKESHLVANQMVKSVNYIPRSIDISATVTGNVTAAEVINRLKKVVQPEALKEDGVTYEWEFGGEVPLSRISHEIFDTDESVTKVQITLPAVDVTLQDRELPEAGTITITVLSSS